MLYSHYSMFGPSAFWPFGFGAISSVFFLVVAVWIVFTIVLKGYALWHSAKLGQIWWFLALLIFNTFGILELIYIIFFLKRWPGKREPIHHEHHEHHNSAVHDHEHTHHTA